MHKLIRYMPERKIHRGRWVSAMQQTQIPLKLICGAADPISGAHMAARYQELVPHANVSLLDDIGHYPQVEAPGLVLAARQHRLPSAILFLMRLNLHQKF